MAFLDTVPKEDQKCLSQGCSIKAGQHCWLDMSLRRWPRTPTPAPDKVYICDHCKRVFERNQLRGTVSSILVLGPIIAFIVYGLKSDDFQNAKNWPDAVLRAVAGVAIFLFIFGVPLSALGGIISELLIPNPPKPK